MIPLLLLACAAQPSVLVIVTDTTRADLGGVAAPRWATPAGDARVYSSAWSAAPYTTASTATLLNGLWPEQHLVVEHPHRNPGILQGPTWVDEASWHGLPTLVVTDHYVPHAMGIDRGDVYLNSDRGSVAEGSVAALTEAAGWVDRRRTGSGWAAYVHVLGPHGPWAGTSIQRASWARMASGEPEDPDTVAWASAGYRDAVEATLEGIEDLIDAAGAGTTVIVTSDHGEAFGESGQWGHGTALDDAQLHVPLWLRGPQVVAGVDAAPVGATAVADAVRATLALPGANACDLRRAAQGCDAPRSGMVPKDGGDWVERAYPAVD